MYRLLRCVADRLIALAQNNAVTVKAGVTDDAISQKKTKKKKKQIKIKMENVT